MSIFRIIAIVLAVLFVLAVARLGKLNEGGPAHNDVMLPGMEPATVYLPGTGPGGDPFYNMFPKPVAERPAAVVLVHGFTADRETMSALARRIAENGYAVIAIDVNGHGENRNPFNGGGLNAGALRDNIKTAVEFLRGYEQVDGSRIVVMGHSMGAGAALDYATHDPNLKASVMISGGWGLGPERPKNALFIFAERDPVDAIQGTSMELAAHLAGVAQIDLGKQYGDFASGNAIEAVRVPGVDHVGIISSPEAAATIVKWLDGAFGTTRSGPIELSEPRTRVARIALILFVILLVPIGRIAGSIAPAWPEARAGVSWWMGLLIVGGALLAAMPLISTATPAGFVPLVIGSIQISWFWVASLIMILVLAACGLIEWNRIGEGFGSALLAAAFAFAIIYVCLVAMSPALHNLSLSPERLMALVLASVILFPFWLGFEFLLRRGGVAFSTFIASVGRVVILVLTGIGVAVHVLPFVLTLVVPILVLNFVIFEIFAASVYSVSRNVVMIAAAESLFFAWVFAAANPITFMF
jgi:dienelactone hydrolase